MFAAAFLPPVFAGAFLLFQIQPLVSKHILPWYGGSPAVWTSCVLFFQTVLFAGYAYAHLSVRWLGLRSQIGVHAVLLVIATLPAVLPDDSWVPDGSEDQTLRITRMLAASIGLPYFALCASGPLLQAWFARACPHRSPYRLFAVSNAGSLLALASYPLWFEPNLPLGAQAELWKWLLVGYILMCSAVALTCRWGKRSGWAPAPATAPASDRTSRTTEMSPRLSPWMMWWWLMWSACGVILFMSVTNQLSTDIAATPFLWVMPLAVYLISFILTFGLPRCYSRTLFAPALLLAFCALYLLLPGHVDHAYSLTSLSASSKIAVTALALLVCCTVCHGELCRLTPPAEHLTRFYLTISAGGVLGGVLVGIVAPRVFLLYHELQIGLLCCAALLLTAMYRDPASRLQRGRPRWLWGTMILGLATMGAISVALTRTQLAQTVWTKRNFFGLLRIKDVGRDDPLQIRHMALFNGSTLHGIQVYSEAMRRLPTQYYSRATGVGVLLTMVQQPAGRRIGVVGMGIATLAAYGNSGDLIRFYEIDPDVVEVAQTHFSFLRDSSATCEVAVGDARLSLQREADRAFDILILDAFSSDAIPVHLLTLQAMQLYRRHLQPHGLMAIHVSNRNLNLGPVVYQLASATGFFAVRVQNFTDPSGLTGSSDWIILYRDEAFLDALTQATKQHRQVGRLRLRRPKPGAHDKLRLWTDDFSNLLQVLR